MPLKTVFAAILITGLSGPALAGAVLPIGGIFGNEAGCHFFMSGDVLNEDFLVLTPDTVTSRATACYFVELIPHRADVHALSASCSGGIGGGGDEVLVSDHGERGIFVTLPGRAEQGPLFPCPGTEGLFRTPGVQV